MKKGFIIFGIILLVVVGMAGLSYGLGWLDVFMLKTIGKEKVDVKRDIYEKSQSYVTGKRQELSKARLEYIKTTDEVEKNALMWTITQSCVDLDIELINDKELRRFLRAMRNGQLYELPSESAF